MSKFQKWVNNSEGAYIPSLQILQGISTLFFILFSHVFTVMWSLAKIQDHWGLLRMYYGWYWHGCDCNGWTINCFYSWLGGRLFGTAPHGSSCHCSYTRVTCHSSKSREGCQGKLYLTSTLPDSLHSTQARHSSVGGCNSPSPGLTNDSKNSKSER